jgi:hypothetical protein
LALCEKYRHGIVFSRARYPVTISCFMTLSVVDGGGKMEEGIMKSLWERHIGHVLLVFLSSFSDLGFVGAEARQLRTHSGEERKLDMMFGGL